MKKTLLFWLSLFSFLVIYGQNGTLDLTFNKAGWKTLSFSKEGNTGYETSSGIFKQGEQGYVVVATRNSGSFLVRIKPGGGIDSTFGIDGFSEPVPSIEYLNAAMQPDGKIVVAAFEYPTTSLAAVRFKANGIIDSTFGTNGIARAPASPFSTNISQTLVTLDSRGRILVGTSGWRYSTEPSGSACGFFIARFTSAGILDTRFNRYGSTPGTAFVSPGTSLNLWAWAMSLQPDGKLVFASQLQLDSDNKSNFTVARIIVDAPTGASLDPSFGTGGIAVTSFPAYSEAHALYIQSDGKIVAGGITLNEISGTRDFVIARYLVNGTPDESFNSGSTVTGTLVVDLGGDDVLNSLAVNNNRITIVGSTYTSTEDGDDVVVARFLTDGSPDTAFDGDGLVISDFSIFDRGSAFLVETDGDILVCGNTYCVTEINDDVMIARYTNSGALDEMFNPGGAIPGIESVYYPMGAFSFVTGMALQPDGKLVVSGVSQVYSRASGYSNIPGVGRLNPDGTLDNSFGYRGVATVDLGAGTYGNASGVAIVPSSGKILIAGSLQTGSDVDALLVQFTPAGKLDTTDFGTKGIVTTKFNGISAQFSSVAIQPDGKIVAAGECFNYSAPSFAIVARFSASGVPDITFGNNGMAIIDFPGGDEQLKAMALQSDGKIIVAGKATNLQTSLQEFNLARLTSEGLPDETFGTNGQVVTAFPGVSAYAGSLAIQADGKILAGGVIRVEGFDSSVLSVIRYTDAGSIDTEFGQGGIASVTFITYQPYMKNSAEPINKVVVQNDGKIILASFLESSIPPPPDEDYIDEFYGVARFNSTGALDNTWGTGGKIVSHYTHSTMLSSALWSNDRLYTGGYLDPLLTGESGLVTVYTAAGQNLGTPAITINDLTVAENAGTAILTVSMDKTSSSSISINYSTKDNTATSKGKNPDFKAAKGIINIPEGSTTATIAITIYDNNASDPDESFFVNLSLSNPMLKLATLAVDAATVTITGDVVPLGNQYTRLNNQSRDPLKFSVKALPNPSTGAFTLELQSASTAPVSIRVHDISGRLIENKSGVATNSTYKIGQNYLPGSYYAEVVQGTEKIVLKLVKQ